MVREDILDRLQVAVRHEMPNCDVHCFGSFAAGLYLPNADMDVVVISQSFRNYGDKSACQSNSKMRAFGRYIEGTVAEKRVCGVHHRCQSAYYQVCRPHNSHQG